MVVSITAGFTSDEIRELVSAYELLPFGGKREWLEAQGVSYHQFRRWRFAIFDGDLDLGLIPRKSGPMSIPRTQRTALERERAKDRAAHAAELERLRTRIEELEGTNEALGKAIGLLHSMREHEPDDTPIATPPSASSVPRTTSSDV